MRDKEYKHTQTIKSANIDNKTLAVEVGDLYYDSLSEFLRELSVKLANDAKADSKRGREKLANSLKMASSHILEASKYIDTAWDICKPHVKEYFKTKKSNRV